MFYQKRQRRNVILNQKRLAAKIGKPMGNAAEGVRAWRQGTKCGNCPYKSGTPEQRAWVLGWKMENERAIETSRDEN